MLTFYTNSRNFIQFMLVYKRKFRSLGLFSTTIRMGVYLQFIYVQVLLDFICVRLREDLYFNLVLTTLSALIHRDCILFSPPDYLYVVA